MRAATALLVLLACALPHAAWAQRRRQLTDDNFEHATQAATGQTTGVWLVLFCSPSARACKELAGPWEELAKQLLQEQLFVTSVDVHASPQLRQRFGVATLPTILLFRDRKMYRYEGKLVPGADHKAALSAWAREQYASGTPLDVPPVPSPFDWLAKAAALKVAAVRTALRTGDLRGLALALLPLLGVCLLAVLLSLANLGRAKPKRD